MLDDATMFDSMVTLAVALNDRTLMEHLYARALSRTQQLVSGGVFGFTWEQPILCGLAKLARGLGRQGGHDLRSDHALPAVVHRAELQ
jgi:hypothetical protein